MQQVEVGTSRSTAGRAGAMARAVRQDDWTVMEFYRAFHPYAADLVEEEPETISQIERWVAWQETAHGREPLFRADGTRAYDAFSLGWALERKHLDDSLTLPIPD